MQLTALTGLRSFSWDITTRTEDLAMSGFMLRYDPLEYLSHLTNLTSLRLHFVYEHCKTNCDIDLLSTLTSLQTLDMNGVGLPYCLIPDEMKTLQSLSLRHMGVGCMDFNCKPHNLTALDLSSNGISELPEDVLSMTGLRSLLLDQNRLAMMPASITSLANLRLLRVDRKCVFPKSISKLAGLTNVQRI